MSNPTRPPPVRKTRSSSSLTSSSDHPTGPLSGPSSVDWRRNRLRSIGRAAALADESTALHQDGGRTNYGTADSADTSRRIGRPRTQRSLPSLPHAAASIRNRSYFRRNISQRPISAYDVTLGGSKAGKHIPDATERSDVRTNGIRVWYSSYSSIDWLHDAIKDSVRFSRLRRGRSLRSRIRLIFDKSLGWIIVTIVGFLTALVAFLVVRGEQWLFDAKEGYCTTHWWLAKRFCCPVLEQSTRGGEGTCGAWRTWSEVFDTSSRPGETPHYYQSNVVEYVAYAWVAIVLAVSSSLLTIYLTASTSFNTRKESGVLSSEFAANAKNNGSIPSLAANEPKRKVAYYAAGSGIPEVKTILSGFVIHGYLGGRTLFTKSVGLALAVASGLSLGKHGRKEGPFIHIASCIGNIVSRVHSKYENNEAKRREILSAACAAGVAVAFGAPVGGTLFSLEEASYFFPPKVMWRSFFCAMIAAMTLRFLDPFGTGKLVLFQVTYDKDWHAYELIFFLILGVLGGIYGAYFSKLNYAWTRHVRNGTWLKSHPLVEVILVTSVTTIFCFLNPYIRMGGTELVYNLFAECRTGNGQHNSDLCVVDPGNFAHLWSIVRAVLVAMVVKGLLTIITFGIKLPAGIFIPTLGVGACAGRIFGIGVQWLHWRFPESSMFSTCGGDMDCVIPGLYAMVGAAAALSGVTRTTVSLAVIMFELTDTLTYAVPVMLSVLVAKTLADALEPKGIYDLVIELSQLPYLDAKQEYQWGNLEINDVTERDVPVIYADRVNTVKILRDKLQAFVDAGNLDGGFPILRQNSDQDDMRMVGYIGASELEHALSIVADQADEVVIFHMTSGQQTLAASFTSLLDGISGDAVDPFDFSIYMDQAPLTIQSNSPLELLHQFFVKLGARYVVVTDTDGYYEGVIDKQTWLAFLSQLEEKS